jgi:hypothetical protein
MRRAACLLVREHDEQGFSKLFLTEQVKQFLFRFVHAKAVGGVQNEQKPFGPR